MKNAIMKIRKEQERANGADEGEEHIFLSVPNVTLASDKIVGGASAADGRAPFNQFVESANRQTDGNKKERDQFFIYKENIFLF